MRSPLEGSPGAVHAFSDGVAEVAKRFGGFVADPVPGIPAFADASAELFFAGDNLGREGVGMFAGQPAQAHELGEENLLRQRAREGVIRDEFGMLLQRNSGTVVDGGLLASVDAKAAKRVAGVGQVAVFKKMKPHFEVHDLTKFGIKAALGIFFTEENGRGFADEIPIIQETGRDDFAAIVASIFQSAPKIDCLGVFIQDGPGRGGERDGRMSFHQGNHFAKGLRVAKFVVAEEEFDVMAVCLFEAMVPIVDHSKVGGVDGETDAVVAAGKWFDDFGGIVGRTVVEDEQFEIAKVLRERGFYGFADKARVIICRNQDADCGWIHGLFCFLVAGGGIYRIKDGWQAEPGRSSFEKRGVCLARNCCYTSLRERHRTRH